MRKPVLVHVTTTDMSLALLLGPQLEAYRAAGYDVYGASAAGPFVERLEAAGVRHLPLRHATRAVAPAEDVRALLELRSLFRALRPDVVHTHNPKPGVYGRVAARMARVPAVVNTVHGLYALPSHRLAKRAVVYGLELIASRCSDAELVQNAEDIPVLRRIGIADRKLQLLGNGVDLQRFRPRRLDGARRAQLRAELGARPDDVLCGVVGRLVLEKGYAEVFAAAAALREVAPNVRIAVVGPSDLDKADAVPAEVCDRASELGVTFTGMRHDVDDLYGAFDLYVLASHREGFPRSAMEAAASGLPIVATDIRGCRQVVDDGVTGVLIPPRDAPALAGAIRGLARDPERRLAMGAAALVKARSEFDQDAVIGRTLATYERLLGRRAGDAPERVAA